MIYVPNLSEIDQSATELLLMIYYIFFVGFRGCSNTGMGVLKTRGPICTKFGGDIVRSSPHTPFKTVKISCSVSKPQQLKVERWSAIRPKIALFDPPVKIRGGVGEIYGSLVVAAPMIESLVYICWPASPRVLRTDVE